MKFMNTFGLLILLSASVVLAQHPNGADAGSGRPAITVDGGWTIFTWLSGPGVFNTEGAFTYSSTGYTDVVVTDAFIDGDQFEVYDNGVLIGTTSVPLDTGAAQADPDLAFADPGWSSGVFTVPPGNHSITILIILTATGFPDGGAYLQITQAANPIPTLGTLGLIAFVLLLLSVGIWVIRRQRQAQIS